MSWYDDFLKPMKDWGGWFLDQAISTLKDAGTWVINMGLDAATWAITQAGTAIHALIPDGWRDGINTLLTYDQYIEIWFPLKFGLSLVGTYLAICAALFTVHKIRQLL